ncbi:MAG: hypothetical protein HOV81_12975 [Kofleriaceae bacterium]|nr:hypothetical protein [Kofleriaceae bacterium]
MKLAVLCLGLALGACADDGGPRLDEVTPSSARVGTSVQIVGRRLCGAQASCLGVAAKVEIGLEPPIAEAMVFAYSDTVATIQIPATAMPGKTALVLTVDGRSSNSLDFEVLP